MSGICKGYLDRERKVEKLAPLVFFVEKNGGGEEGGEEGGEWKGEAMR